MPLRFKTDDFDVSLKRVEEANATILDGPLYNANAQHHEHWLR